MNEEKATNKYFEDYENWRLARGSARTDGSERSLRVPPARPEGAPLSKAHITPFIEYFDGASLLKCSEGKKFPRQAGGIRGQISKFSKASRRRLLYLQARVRKDCELPLFVSLTQPDKFVDNLTAKVQFDTFIKRMVRKFPELGIIWKFEPQKRGAGHFHFEMWGVSLDDAMMTIPQIWYEIAGQGDVNHFLFHKGRLGNQHCVQLAQSWRGVWAYTAKYLGKTFEDANWVGKWTGRFWGTVQRENIPFGERRIIYGTLAIVRTFKRCQRKLSKVRDPGPGRSLTIFCDANQWIERLYPFLLKENLQV